MLGRAEIQFQLPVLYRLFFAILVESFLDSFLNTQGATSCVGGTVTEKAFGEFVVGVTFAALLKLRDTP